MCVCVSLSPRQDPNLHSTLRCDEFRSLFAAPPGRALIVADYSQIELRGMGGWPYGRASVVSFITGVLTAMTPVLAELSRDENMLSAFRTGDDLHTFTASRLLSIPPQQVTKEQRRLAKAVNFGRSVSPLADRRHIAGGMDCVRVCTDCVRPCVRAGCEWVACVCPDILWSAADGE